VSEPVHYEPSLESLRRHPVPGWYHDAKLGIFIHWTLAAVPGFAPREHDITQLLRTRYRDFFALSPYAEWYENSLRFPWSPAARHHLTQHGGRAYAEFKDAWVAALEGWDPAEWARRFAAAGARYVVLVAKHHDGFCLWPSTVAHPHRSGWCAPRDCVGELAAAVRAVGLRFGVYYSGGLDWTFDATPIRSFGDLGAAIPGGRYPAYAEAQLRELVERLRPDVLWNDIAWPGDLESFVRVVAHYYEQVPEGVVNDRWLTASVLTRAMRLRPLRWLADRLLERRIQRPDADVTPPPSRHFDVRTPEYAVFPEVRREKWECVRGMDRSFGFNRASHPEDFLSRDELIHGLVDIASKNGNLLLNVGPRGCDAAIPEPQQQRLDWLGSWTSRYGEAIYGTRPWRRAEGRTRDGLSVRFTQGSECIYAIVLGLRDRHELVLEGLGLGDGARVRRVGGQDLRWKHEGSDLCIALDPMPDEPAHAFELRGVR
jgi:alpha-L-fucosidase